MLIGDKLAVFENFVEDFDLPKYERAAEAAKAASYHGMSKDATEDHQENSPNVTPYRTQFRTAHTTSNQTWVDVASNGRGMLTTRLDRPKHGWFMRFLFWFTVLFSRRRKPEPVLMSVEQFFSSVKNTSQELAIVRDRAAGYESAIESARAAGQQALLESLSEGLNAYRMETQLLAAGMKKYVEEKTIVDFYKQSDRGMRLDWVRNFVRPIPSPVLEHKIKADEIGIFDNYAVLHYDPEAKSYKQTQQEKEAERLRKSDPILFGLMKGSRKLYFVGDWVDEYCDLTLEQIADALGASAVKEIGGTP